MDISNAVVPLNAVIHLKIFIPEIQPDFFSLFPYSLSYCSPVDPPAFFHVITSSDSEMCSWS